MRAVLGPVVISLLTAAWVWAAFTTSGSVITTAIAGIPIAVVILYRPRWGIVALVVATPLVSALSPGLATKGLNYGLPLLIGLGWLMASMIKNAPVRLLPGGLTAWFLIFVGWILACSPGSELPGEGFTMAGRYFAMGVFLIVLVNLWSPALIKTSLIAQGIILIPVSLYGVYQVAVNGITATLYGSFLPTRLTSIYENPNMLGIALATPSCCPSPT